jgi:hypothetical protein
VKGGVPFYHVDDGSFFFFVRTQELVVGQTYEYSRYFRPDPNPVTIRVLRRERVRVPAGEFDTIVLEPVIKTKGIFSEKGEARTWLSDDKDRVMVKMTAKLPFGSLKMSLKSFRRGGDSPDNAGVIAGARSAEPSTTLSPTTGVEQAESESR